MIGAAEELFREHGFDSVTMDLVAEKAEFSKRTLYQYFSGKDDLVCACILEAFGAFDRYLEPLIEAAGNGKEKLLALGRAHSNFRKDERYYHGAIAYSLYETGGGECRAWVSGMYAKIEQYLRLGGSDGSLRSDIDPHRVSYTIGAMMNGLLMLEGRMDFIDSAIDGYGELIDESFALLLRALEAK
jgi:AcrR family transcriptional regulator